jgi:hypothetical protein
LEGFSYVLQIDMHFICTPMWTKFYSCKKWVLQDLQRSMAHSMSLSLDLSDRIIATQREIHYLRTRLTDIEDTLRARQRM